MRAFVLGAGLGTRLRPLTDVLPKPLIPLGQSPLIHRAFEHLSSLGVRSFVVNTHHLPEKYEEFFPDGRWEGRELFFRHEPVLLETAGGLANVADLLEEERFWVYNGDIFSTMNLCGVEERHVAEGWEVTLVLRTPPDHAGHVAWDAASGQVTDIRGYVAGLVGRYQFTGVYLVSQRFLRRLEVGKKESVIRHFVDMIRGGGGLGGVLVDDGVWMDLGERGSYMEAHRVLARLGRDVLVHPEARVAASARVEGWSFVGAGAEVGEACVVRDTVIWPGVCVPAGSVLEQEICFGT